MNPHQDDHIRTAQGFMNGAVLGFALWVAILFIMLLS